MNRLVEVFCATPKNKKQKTQTKVRMALCAKVQKKLNIPKILYWVVYTAPYLQCQLATRDLALQVKKAAASLHSEKIFLSRLGR